MIDRLDQQIEPNRPGWAWWYLGDRSVLCLSTPPAARSRRTARHARRVDQTGAVAMSQPSLSMVVSEQAGGANAVEMPALLCRRLLRQAQDLHAAGWKGFGLLVGDPARPGHPFRPVDVVVFDPRRNRRNEPANRAAFHAQGAYFRQFDDAGFVADPADVLAAWRMIEDAGLEVVAPFHVHRRQPANFSMIDYRLHNPAFAWHLIISLRDPSRPVVQPFGVRKEATNFGIDERDDREGSELPYPGPEVSPLGLHVAGSVRHLRALRRTLHPAADTRPRHAQPVS